MPRPLLVLLLSGILATSAHADRCGGIKETTARSPNGRFLLTAKRLDDSRQWQARLEDTQTKQVVNGSLGDQSFHPHIEVLIPDDGSRIILFEPRASDREARCLQVFDRDFKLLREFPLKDLLTKDERSEVKESVSHYTFTSKDPEKGVSSWLEEGGKTFVFHAVSGRRVSVPLVSK